jgi:hypothetical protein
VYFDAAVCARRRPDARSLVDSNQRPLPAMARGPRLLAAGALLLAAGEARIHQLTISKDPRYAFSIESFGFYEGGSVSVHIRHVDAKPPGAGHIMGFVLYPSTTESRINEQVDTLIVNRQCALDATNEGIYKLNVSDPANWCAGPSSVGCGQTARSPRRDGRRPHRPSTPGLRAFTPPTRRAGTRRTRWS